MRRQLVFCVLLAGCGDNLAAGPFEGLPVDGRFTVGLEQPASVARDRFGVAHIHAKNIRDAAFVQGYVMAHDRLPQMDILRRYGAGTLSELFGALDASIIDTDLEMRVHRMRPLAQQTFDTLSASSDPTDQAIVSLLQRFADGVNAYATDLKGGSWTLDDDIATSFDVDRFTPWDPVDSLVLGRFQAFALSWSTPFELDATELYQKLRATFDQGTSPAAVARAGISRDVMRFAPVGTIPTIPDFPNFPTDGCTRSDGAGCSSAIETASPLGVARVTRPTVPQALLDNARSFFKRGTHTGPLGALGPHAFMHPYAGSNNWAVKTATGALLATDQHLQLPNPSIFYPTHITVEDPAAPLDVLGVTFPGIPGVILGTNGKVAWSGTVSEHDVNDVYQEDTSGCGGHCVKLNGQDVPIQTFTETIVIGALGTKTGEKTVTYELVPHHGPIIPTIDHANHTLVPRTGSTALSVRYTGYEPTFEIRALWNLDRATDVKSGFQALADFSYGSQNWTMIDTTDTIGWTTNAVVPDRDPRAYTWNAKTNPDGLAPFLILPGTGEAEWEGRMPSRYVPHAISSQVGFLATANADPVGATFDNDPLNQGMVDGRPLYAGVTYAAGVREERISQLIAALPPATATLDQMSAIQHDSSSTVGPHMVPVLRAALDGTTTAPDLAAYRAGLSPADAARLATAQTLMAGWSYATPASVDAANADSAATALFNTWMHYFIIRSVKDEFDAMSFDVWRLDDNQLVRLIFAMLVHPDQLTLGPSGQPVLCDDYASPTDDSCTKMILVAMVDAMTHLEGPDGFATPDTAQWRWGKLHRLTISPLFPNSALDLPTAAESPLGGFPKAGDNFVINRADMGWSDTSFSQYADGPAQRFLAQTVHDATGDSIAVKWALPGGVIYDKRSPHYRDLLDNYYLPQEHFDAPFTVADIVAAGESRWDFK